MEKQRGTNSRRAAGRRDVGRSESRDSRGIITAVAGGRLPKWVREEVLRTTPRERRDPALDLLAEGVAAFAEERFRPAAKALRAAKQLAPQAATIRELLGLACYDLELWEEALRELRTFRRLAGDTSHMPVEMDCLRALERSQDVEKAWDLFRELGGSHAADQEARVVYGSYLLDQGRHREAWEVVKPGRLVADPAPVDVRLWFVAARVAVASGDLVTARSLYRAMRRADPTVPGLDELAAAVGSPGSTR